MSLRPWVKFFLEEASKIFEIVVFTASEVRNLFVKELIEGVCRQGDESVGPREEADKVSAIPLVLCLPRRHSYQRFKFARP